MFTHLYYLRVVIYCSCYFFSRGRGRNFDVSLAGRPQQTTRIHFHNTQHEGTPFRWLLWHSLNSLPWYIWSGFLCFCAFKDQIKAWVHMGLCVVTLSWNSFFALFYENTNSYMIGPSDFKNSGIFTKELYRPTTFLLKWVYKKGF